jgi:hypothetical protein
MQIEKVRRFVCWFSLSLYPTKTPLASTSIVPGPSSTNPISTWPPASNLKALGMVRWTVFLGSAWGVLQTAAHPDKRANLLSTQWDELSS